ncbi:glutamine amidotransferase [Pararhodobacter sp. CCB-MM2]|uniref:glutamine amidotransferase n=1 Tax=Pararhodobacter sp. CCB-MM2 TaxID=1786003 RepID=UPI00082CD948|nr:glutamine amidotransferase [Pararhodobacter sp. CCB-MM2]
MQTKPLLIQTGTPPDALRAAHGDLPAWFSAALGLAPGHMTVVRAFEGETPPAPDVRVPTILTGSWSMVTERAAWSENLAAWIRDAMAIEAPLFGVCYGHQLIAHALGGVVGYHPDGREIGSQKITLTASGRADPALGDAGSDFVAQLTHMQTVLTPPPGAVVLAASAHDPHQVLRYGPNALSTQFHPEFTTDIMRGIIASRETVLRDEGRDPQNLQASVTEAPFPLQMLRRFVAGANPEASE